MNKIVLAAFALIFTSASASLAQNFSSEELGRRAIQRRAVEAINWGMPAVNFDLMLQAMISSAKGKPNQIVYWSRLPDWKNQTLTPNPDVIYLMPFFNTKDVGPMVLEIPPADGGSITGTIMDAWQSALEDVGPAGVDKGKGGKYLIEPPGYKGNAAKGYIVLPSMTYQGYALLRSNLASGSDADVAKAVAYAKRIKFYPLSQAANPPPTTFVDAIDVVYDATIPYDVRFFQSLDRIVQTEPWLPRDKVMIDMLKSIGIEKGKPFNPDPKTRDILNAAAREAQAWLDARYEAGFPSFYEGRQWALPASPELAKTMGTFYEGPNAYSVDGRGLADYYAYSTTKRLGAGQYYLMAAKDKDRRALDGASDYRLNVPADAPVRLYWSATVYDRATHALIRDQKRVSRSSLNPGLQKNADGSVDVYFGPKAPAGKETNWVPTSASGKFEVLFRLYGPEKPLYDKTWKLPDIERTTALSQAQPAPPTPASNSVPVTADNIIRAESDAVFSGLVAQGGFGKFYHNRELTPIDNHTVQRANRDTLYSTGVFDLDAGPVTITLPDAGERFLTMIVIDEDHYVFTVVYGAGRYTVTKAEIGTRYAVAAIRILVNPSDPKDVALVNALQDAVKVEQPDGPGKFEVPNWDKASQKKVRDVVLGGTIPDWRHAAGRKGEVDPVRHLIVTTTGWGLNPDKDAIYLNVTPSKNDGKTLYKLDVKDVPVDGFWSISLYNAEGFFEPNNLNAYTLNNITAKKSDDGSVAVRFGGCDGKIPNCLPTVDGWNYMVRLYRPRPEILNGTWKCPEAQSVN